MREGRWLPEHRSVGEDLGTGGTAGGNGIAPGATVHCSGDGIAPGATVHHSGDGAVPGTQSIIVGMV